LETRLACAIERDGRVLAQNVVGAAGDLRRKLRGDVVAAIDHHHLADFLFDRHLVDQVFDTVGDGE
jgi:hypothetical protein